MLDSTGLQFTMGVGELPDDTFRVYEFDIAEALSEVFTLNLTAFSRASHGTEGHTEPGTKWWSGQPCGVLASGGTAGYASLLLMDALDSGLGFVQHLSLINSAGS